MGKNVGLTYGEFKFPAEQGFTGSAGVHKVRGYMRGGHVKKGGSKLAKGTTRMAEGGKFGKPGDKYPNKGAHQTMPAKVKAKGGYMKGGMHDKLKHEGAKMGYAYGGQVKDTSGEFVEKRGKQDTMDHGVQPARRGRNQAEIEAGGTKRLKPGMQTGGAVEGAAGAGLGKGAKKALAAQVRRVRGPKRISGTGRTVRAMTGLVRRDTKKGISKALKASKKNMPKNVKAKGGLAKYAHGGRAKAAGDKMSHSTGRGRKPYTGYNKQAGGSGNEDARYMHPKK